MILYLLVPLFFIIPVFIIGTYVFARNPRNTITRIFFFYSLIGTLAVLSEYEFIISGEREAASAWLRFHISLWPVLFAAQLHFLLAYTNAGFSKATNIIFGVYAAALLVSVNTFINKPFHDIVQVWFGYIRNPLDIIDSTSEIVFAGFMTLLTLLFTLTGIVYLKKPATTKQDKEKVLLIMAGLLVPAWIPFLKNAILPASGIAVLSPDFPFVFAGWICFAIAIRRYDMFDITTKTVADEIVSTMKETLMLADEDGIIISVNEAFYRLFGHGEKEIAGQSVNDFLKNSPDAEKKLGTSYKTEEIRNRICIFDTKDKKGAHLSFSVSFLKNRKQKIVGFVFLISDVSELIESENQLQKQQENLVEIARQAGMAEIATNTMHNIGNILNSVNISSEHFISTIENLKVKEFEQASDLILANSGSLQEFFATDEKGKILPDYLGSIIEELEEQHNTLTTEKNRLAEKIRVIEESIAAQQAQTKRKTVDKNITEL